MITEEEIQNIKIIVPVGHVTFRYQKADGSPDKDVKLWIIKGNDPKWATYGQKAGNKFRYYPARIM